MKVISVKHVTAEIIKTDEKNYPIYRRGGPEQWENLIYETWESYYDDGELEAAYQAFKEEQNDITTSDPGGNNPARSGDESATKSLP